MNEALFSGSAPPPAGEQLPVGQVSAATGEITLV